MSSSCGIRSSRLFASGRLPSRAVRGIEAGEYERRYRAPFAPLETLLQGYVRMGLAKQVDDRWRFTPRGFLLSNQLIGELLDAQAEQRYKPRPYSP